jgi:hypothetical protein
VPAAKEHPIFRGVHASFWIPDDVYGVSESLSGDSTPVLMGQPLQGWSPEDAPVPDKKPLPIAWTKSYTGAAGKKARIFTSTMGHGEAFKIEDFRRMLANSCLWCLGMDAQIVAKTDMSIPGNYAPGAVGAKGLKPGIRPADLR